jgi:hypothetical protein
MLHRDRSRLVVEARKRAAAPFRSDKGRRGLSGGAIALAALAVVLTGTVGAGTSLAQTPDFCPPTFVGPGGSLTGTAAQATRTANGAEVTLSYSFAPSSCPATMTISGADGGDVQVPFSNTDTPGTSRAVRVTAGNLCVLSHAPSLNLLGEKTGHADRGPCEQALLAFYVGPTPDKTGTAVRQANTCELLAIGANSSKVSTAHREQIPITLTITQIGGEEGLLGEFSLSVKVSDGSAHGVRLAEIVEPTTLAQFKQCNAP